MSVNMPNHPFPSDSISNAAKPASAPETQRSPSKPDTLEKSSTGDLSRLMTESRAPKLEGPQSNVSIIGAYRIYVAAMAAYKQYLAASDSANLEASRKFSTLAVDQANEFAALIARKETAVSKLNEEIKNKLNEFQKKLGEMERLQKAQQSAIDQINSGNGVEKKQFEELTHAYDTYVSKMKSIGAIDQGNGNFLIPEHPNDPEKNKETKDKYNQFTNDYQQAVGKFNTEWRGRSDLIAQYNTATSAYNQSVAEYNQAVNEFLNQNFLSSYLREKGIAIPQLANASRRDISTYQERMPSPSPIASVPSAVYTFPPPAYARSIAQAGPPALPKLNEIPPFKVEDLHQKMYQNAYDTRVASYDQAILQYTSFWSFIMFRNVFESVDKDLSFFDTLLNSKPLANKLIPPSTPSMSLNPSTASSIAMDTLHMNVPHLQVLLGKSLIKEALKNANLEGLEKLQNVEQDKKIDQLADKILLLSIGLLGNLNIQALFPSLGMIADQLPSLPKDSPAFAILFAVSLSNRILENVSQGISTETVQAFLKANPELANLSEADQAKLEAAFNLGQLLVAGKLMENNLGLQGLLAQILPALFPSLNLAKIIPQALQENQQASLELQAQIKEHFVGQGYSEDKAQFLAQTAAEITQNGLLTPNVTANISAKTLNLPLLENSIKAELVLNHYELPEADKIAHQAVDLALLEGPFSSTKQFRTVLESQLNDFQVKNSTEIVKSAMITPPPEKSLTSPSSTTPSPAEWNSLLQQRTLQLLTPQLGPQLAQQISQEIGKTLFGTARAESNDIANIQSPYAWVKVTKDQVNTLINAEQTREVHDKWTDHVTETFKESSIKMMESFYTFSLKLMDPASSFIFASTIIHGDEKVRKRGIDIPI